MGLVTVLVMILVGLVIADEQKVMGPRDTEAIDGVADTELLLALVIFRHGDRTPDQEELEKYPSSDKKLNDRIFFPYGKKALTNKGKQRSFFVGKYLRQLYDGLISRLYLPDEVTIRTTSYARTQMTALAALSALYPPPPAQMWNPSLNWQPIPYNTPPASEDDLLYWYECPRYMFLRNKVYDLPEFRKQLEPYQGLFKFLTENTGSNITTSEDVFYLDNLFQTLSNVGVDPPRWAQQVMPKIKAVTKLEYAAEFYTSALTRLASGVLMQYFLNVTNSAVNNTTANIEPKLHLVSAHENNVAGLMSAARVFEPHQPNYGATFSLELRKNLDTQKYGIVAVYSRDAGGPAKMLPVNGCGGSLFCDYDKFVELTREIVMTKPEMDYICKDVTNY